MYNIYTHFMRKREKTTKHESSDDSKKKNKTKNSFTRVRLLRNDIPLIYQGLPYMGSVRPDGAIRETKPVPYSRSIGGELDFVILSRKLHISRGVEVDNK